MTGEHTLSKSGVRLANDYRDNLIVDRYDPQLAAASGKKLDAMRSENSEDVITWNVFRSLGKVDPGVWVPVLHQQAFPAGPLITAPSTATVRLWVQAPPPPGLRRGRLDEGTSELDIVIETDAAV